MAKMTKSVYPTGFTDEQENDLRAFYRAVNKFRLFRAHMPFQYVTLFLEVALNPGRPLTWYADKLGILQPVISRQMLDLSEVSRGHEPGLQLVTIKQNPMDRRENVYQLSDKGRHLARQILEELEVHEV